MVPASSGPDYIYFPAVSIYDEANKELVEIKPEQNVSVNGGVLKLDFLIPEHSKYLVIHTKDKYLNYGVIEGGKGGISHDSIYSSKGLSVAVAGVLGGAIGGAIAGGISAGDSSPSDFYFAHGGVLNLYVNR